MAINFPEPVVDDTYLYGGKQWICTSTDPAVWQISSATETGNTEGNTGEVAYYDTNGSIIKGATAFYYDATSLKVGIGTSGPDQTLGISGDFYVSAGATFGGNVNLLGNLLLPEDGEVSIGGDTEKIVFNGAGSGSSSIDMYVANTDFGTNSASGTLRSANDEDTTLNFVKDKHGSGSDGLELKQSGNVMIDVTPTQVHFPFVLSADAGATFGGDVLISGGATGVALTIEADTDNSGENENPLIHMVQDGGAAILDIGLAGLVSQALYTDATNNAAYLNSPDEWSDIQFATNDKARMTIHRTTGKVGIGTTTPRESLEVRGNVMSNAGISGATFSVGSNIAFSDGTTFGSTQTEIIGVAVDNGTQVLTTGIKGHRVLPYDCEVTEWRINSRDSGGVTWDVNWCDWDAYPTTASVGGSGLPIINSNTAAGYSGSDTSINWTKKSFNAGDILEFEVDTVDVMTNCTLSLKIRRNG